MQLRLELFPIREQSVSKVLCTQSARSTSEAVTPSLAASIVVRIVCQLLHRLLFSRRSVIGIGLHSHHIFR